MALQAFPGALPEDLDADPNASAQKEEQEFQFINLRELINKQLSIAVQELYSNLAVAQNAATSYETQAAQLVQENRRLRKRLAAAGLLQNREVAAGTGELLTSDATSEALPLRSEVLQFSAPLGSGSGHRPPPPNFVEACGPSEPVPEMRVTTPKTEKTAWEDEGAGSGTTGGAKEQNTQPRRRKSRQEQADEVRAGDTGNTDSEVEAIDDKLTHEPIVDKLHEGHYTPIMPLQEQDSLPAVASMATDLDLEDVQDTATPRHDRMSLEAREAQDFASLEAEQDIAGQSFEVDLTVQSLEAQQTMKQAGGYQFQPTRNQQLIVGTTMADDAQAHRNPYIGISLFCVSCGTRFVDDAAFCCKCGGRRQDGPDIVGVNNNKEVRMNRLPNRLVNRHIVGFNDNHHRNRDLGKSPSDKKFSTHSRPSAGTTSPAMAALGSSPSSPSMVNHAPKIEAQNSVQGMTGQATEAKANQPHFQVLPVWDSSQHGNSHHKKMLKKEAARNNPLKSMKTFGSSIGEKQPKSQMDNNKGMSEQRDFRTQWTKWCHIMHPNDPRRGFWDTTSLFLVLYDMGAIPFEFFDPPVTNFSIFMTWVTRMFWTMDIGFSFFTGYVTNDGFIELRPSKIAKRYSSSWLGLDICIVLVDWMELLMTATSTLSFARMGKASRTFRIIRMLRLLRLARMREVLGLITERINSEKVVIIADILKTMTIILGLAHLIACVWYAVGTTSPQGESWVDKAGYARSSIADRYFISLHWSIAQFAGGMDEVTPRQETERIFAIGMFVLAFIVASVFVSAITSSMTQLNIIGSHQSQQVSTLRRYLHQNGISNKLAVRIQRNAQHALIEQLKILPESAVTLLNVVSEPLRVEIHLEMYAPVLNVHHFFAKYIEECPQVMRKVCHIATNVIMISAGDVIFSAGEIPSQPKMYIVCSGKLEYEHGRENNLINVGEDHCISEASLWVEWMHRGSLMATSDCRLCVLDAKKFQHICGQFSHGNFDPESYARNFVKDLNDAEMPTDLPFDFDPRNSVRQSGSWALKRRPHVQVHQDSWLQSNCKALTRCFRPESRGRKLDKFASQRLFDTRFDE